MESFPKSEKNPNYLAEQLGLLSGAKISLNKVKINDDLESGIGLNKIISGHLKEDVKLYNPIFLSDQSTETANTTAVMDVFEENGLYYIETQTSIYQILSIERNNAFEGLELKNIYGEVHTPDDMKFAQLGEDIIEKSFRFADGSELSFYINKPNLKGVLLEVDGAEIFRAMQGRLLLVAKVGNGHLPFYISSSGESGKIEGKWYPFFGYYGGWIIKGHVEKTTGQMYYSDTITAVQNILNENLRIPAKYITPSGKFGTNLVNNEYEQVFVDLNSIFKYKIFSYESGLREEEYVKRITGYDPKHIDDKDSSPWRNEIVKALG